MADIGKTFTPKRGHREPWDMYPDARQAKREQWARERAEKEAIADRMAKARAAKKEQE